jgi:16S rRNA (cytosine1402-N4)-methyltransferase
MLLSPPVPDPAAAGHSPVLLAATVQRLAPSPGRTMLDCTLGAGGHAEALLEAGALVVGVDRDPLARRQASERLARFGERFTVRAGTFGEAAEELVQESRRFDGVLADLGVSSMQLDDPARGFSIRSTAPADMRMGEGCADDALSLIARLGESELADLIYAYGEERHSRRIARALKRDLALGRIASAADLAETVRRAVGGSGRRHPAIRTFQALRIAVNDELGQLDRLLDSLPRLLQPGGMAVVITFHSLEDRAVKQSFRAGHAAGSYAEVARRVEIAGEAELAANPRASSAKLRWAASPPQAAPGDPQQSRNRP